MRLSKFYKRFISILLLSLAVLAIVRANDGSVEKKPRVSPGLSPEYVELLKKQAEERKTFYASQAKAKSDLKEKQVGERQELLEKHRTARTKFSEQTHTVQERH